MDSLHDLVKETRRLGQARPGSSERTNRRRCGDQTLPTVRNARGLPSPRIVEPEALPEPPPKSDVFSDFAIFGERISQLMEGAEKRRTQPRRCTPFHTDRDTHVIVRRRKSPRPQTAPGENQTGRDQFSRKLAAAGLAAMALAAIALVVLSAPDRAKPSRVLARQPIPQPQEAVATDAPSAPSALPPAIAGSVEEPGMDDID